jgi:hypothetical protein
MAYEYFRRLHTPDARMRFPLDRIRASTNYVEGHFGQDTFLRMKRDIENADCGTDQLVVIPTLV